MKRWTVVAVCVVGWLVASNLLSHIHPFGNASLSAGHAHEAASIGSESMPPTVRATLVADCTDCHSNSTRAPFYAHFAPASWLMESDINRARRAMDLSVWANYSAEERQNFAVRIASEARSGAMPPVQYRLIHWNARPSHLQVDQLNAWAENVGGNRASASQSPPAEERGRVVFEKRCTGCHALDRDREGPRLGSVYGRASAAVAGFNYSAPLQKLKVTWDEKTLDRWLADPQAMAPGNDMDFFVAKLDDRADLIAFLRAQAKK